jgi:hypothetical protein
MKSQDVLVLLKIFLKEPGKWTISLLAHELFISKSEIHAAICRLKKCGLVVDSPSFKCKAPSFVAMEEFLIHGLKYVFPSEIGKLLRGIPTSHSAPPLSKMFEADEDDVYVWPYEFGNTRGKSIEPLYRSSPKAAEVDRQLYEILVLIDGIRIGRARERKVSADELRKRIKERRSHFEKTQE